MKGYLGCNMSNQAVLNATSPAGAYNSVAGEYDTFYRRPGDIAEDKAVADYLQAKSALMGDVLDVGCGTGLLLDITDIPARRYVGIDPSEGMLEVGRKKHGAARFDIGSFERMTEIADESCDSLVCIYGGFSYVLDPARAISEMLRVMRKGARFAIMPFGSTHKGSGILVAGEIPVMEKRWKAEDIVTAFGESFDELEVRGFGGDTGDLLACLPAQEGCELLGLELSVTDDRYLSKCRYLIVSGVKS